MVDQRIDQRAAGMARSRVGDQTRRLVDHDQPFILEHDFKRNILAQNRRVLGLRRVERHHASRREFARRVQRDGAVHGDAALLDQCLQPGAGKSLRRLGEKAVQPFARRLGPDLERGDFAHVASRARRLARGAVFSCAGGETSGPSAATIASMSGRSPGR